jgi:hypothetical protein
MGSSGSRQIEVERNETATSKGRQRQAVGGVRAIFEQWTPPPTEQPFSERLGRERSDRLTVGACAVTA